MNINLCQTHLTQMTITHCDLTQITHSMTSHQHHTQCSHTNRTYTVRTLTPRSILTVNLNCECSQLLFTHNVHNSCSQLLFTIGGNRLTSVFINRYDHHTEPRQTIQTPCGIHSKLEHYPPTKTTDSRIRTVKSRSTT